MGAPGAEVEPRSELPWWRRTRNRRGLNAASATASIPVGTIGQISTRSTQIGDEYSTILKIDVELSDYWPDYAWADENHYDFTAKVNIDVDGDGTADVAGANQSFTISPYQFAPDSKQNLI